MDKKGLFIWLIGSLLVLTIGIILLLASLNSDDKDISVDEQTKTQELGNFKSESIIFNGNPLTDHTTFNQIDNSCTGNNLGMEVKIFPCKAQDADGRDVTQYVNFTWHGASARNTSWVFVYDGELQSGKIEALINHSYTYIDTTLENRWVNNYLVIDVNSYEDVGTPTSSCAIGNINNTRMFKVNKTISAGDTAYIYYCFTTVNPVNSTAFRISGNYDAEVKTEKIGYKVDWKDISNQINHLGNGLLNDDRSYYQIRNVEFSPEETIQTKWVYTGKDNSKVGKWHILGVDGGASIPTEIASNRYIYLDPWWNASWAGKRNITNLTGSIVYLNISFGNFTGAQADFDDIRFLNPSENTEMPYVIESYVASDHAVFRVLVNGNTSMMVYYGNAAVGNNSNPTSVYGNTAALYYSSTGTGTTYFNSNKFASNNDMTISSVGIWETNGYTGTGINITKAATPFIEKDNPVALAGGTGLAIAGWYYLISAEVIQHDGLGAIRVGDASTFNFNPRFNTITQIGANLYMPAFGEKSALAYYGNNWAKWTHVVAQANTSTIEIYINGSLINRTDFGSPASFAGITNMTLGNDRAGQRTRDLPGVFDEVQVYNRTLSREEIEKLANYTKPNFVIGSESTQSILEVTLTSPANSAVLNVNYTNLTALVNATGSVMKKNVTFYVWNASSVLMWNSSTISLTVSNTTESASAITRNLTDGVYTWGALAWANDSTNSDWSENRTFTINTGISYGFNNTLSFSCYQEQTNRTVDGDGGVACPTITLNYSGNYSISGFSGPAQPINLQYDANWSTFGYGGLGLNEPSIVNVTYYKPILKQNSTSSSLWMIKAFGDTVRHNESIPFACWNNSRDFVLFELRTYILANPIPSTNLFSCWNGSKMVVIYNYTDTSPTSPYGIVEEGIHWDILDYIITENGQSYNNVTVGGEETFTINITYSDYFSTLYNSEFAQLIYDGITYNSTNVVNGNTVVYTAIVDVLSEPVSTSNIFYWNITYRNSSNVMSQYSLQNTQTVVPINITNCSSATDTLVLNYTIKDEDSQLVMPATAASNLSSNVLVSIYDKQRINLLVTFNSTYNNTNNIQVCVPASVLNNTNYSLDAQVQYTADNYVTRFNNIQNFTLSNTTIPQNINLFNIITSRGQVYTITIKDETFLPIDGAVFQINRKYIAENQFKTVESPVSNEQGQVIGHLITNDQIYQILVLKNGQLLATFNNVYANCQNPTVQDCVINLNVFSSTQTFINPETYQNIVFDLTIPNSTDRTARVTYYTRDGSSSSMVLNVSNLYKSQTVCTTSLISSSGSLSCLIPTTFGNGTFLLSLYKDGSLVGTAPMSIQEKASSIFGPGGTILTFIMYGSLSLMLIGNVIVMLIGGIIGLSAAMMLNIYSGSASLGVASALVWLIVAAGIVIWKLSRGSNG